MKIDPNLPCLSDASAFTMSKNFERQLNTEALDALEETLIQQEEINTTRMAEFDRLNRRQQQEFEWNLTDIMNKMKDFDDLSCDTNEEVRDKIVERDAAMQDLRNVELAFSDVHRKYERARTVMENLSQNEEHLKQRSEELLLQMDSRDQKYEAFKQEAQLTVDKVYYDFQTKIATLDNDNARLTAQLRRTEMRAEALESELSQKQRENEQLNSLADELINKKK